MGRAGRTYPCRRRGPPVAPPVLLSRGPAIRHLVYVPSPMAPGGAHQYARFAAHFHGRREVAVPSVPGFGRDEPQPLSFDAVVDVLVEGPPAAAGDAPFVLLDTYLPDDGGATTTCGVRCSRECRTARTASAGSAPHVWPP